MDARHYLLTESPKARRVLLDGGLSMGAHAYRHLEQSAPMMRKLICMYTIYLIWIDDAFVEDTSAIDAFNMRFVHGQEQNTRDLDDFARLIREMAGYYDTVSANLFLTSTMNFVTSLTFEFQTQGMAVGFFLFFFCLGVGLMRFWGVGPSEGGRVPDVHEGLVGCFGGVYGFYLPASYQRPGLHPSSPQYDDIH